MTTPISRRRVIKITAAAAGLSLLPIRARASGKMETVTWQGQALGAAATMQLHHHNRAQAERLVAASVAEVRRLEHIFSLYQDDSALVRLNREGALAAPPSDLVALLGECRRYHDLTEGAFDPTVQPLWALYHGHFATPGASPDGPNASEIRRALELVGFGNLAFDRDRIVLRRGMSLTLNGIAQGYITDRVVEILRAGGVGSSLVDMGESRAIGTAPDGRTWRIGIADPNDPISVAETLDLADQAVATSGGYGFAFDREGRFNHLLDPRTGHTARLHRSVTVIAPTATEADALSTAFSLNPVAASLETLQRLGRGRAIMLSMKGQRQELLA